MDGERFVDNEIGFILKDKVRKREVTNVGIMMLPNKKQEEHRCTTIEDATAM